MAVEGTAGVGGVTAEEGLSMDRGSLPGGTRLTGPRAGRHLAAPATTAAAPVPFAGAAFAVPVDGYPQMFGMLAGLSVLAAVIALGTALRPGHAGDPSVRGSGTATGYLERLLEIEPYTRGRARKAEEFIPGGGHTGRKFSPFPRVRSM
jgi:hypothetical protein